MLTVRELDPSEAGRLRTFDAFLNPHGWQQVVDEMLRDLVPELLATGRVRVLAVFDGDEVVAVAAWTTLRNDTVWHCSVLGVRFGRQHRGIGGRLKLLLLDRARAAGVRFVTSTVHCDNAAMIAANERLGATVQLDPADPYRRHYVYTFDLGRQAPPVAP